MSVPAGLRILHVVATNQRRGGETYAADLIRGLVELGADQRVAVLRSAGGPGVRFPAPSRVVGGGRRLPGLGVDPSAIRRLGLLASSWRPAVVHAFGGEPFKHAALALRRPGPALVYGRIGASWIASGPRVLAYRALLRRADRVVALAEALARETIQVFGVPEERVVVIPNCVHPSYVAPAGERGAVREELGVPPDAPVILALGALAPEKDPLGQLDVAAGAMQKVPEAVYVVAGDGPLRPPLERAVRDRGLGERVRILGARSDVGDLLTVADALLLASRSEGVPRVILEAGMAGVPAAAYAVAGIPEAVDDGETGLLAPEGDAAALTLALVSLLTDDDLRRSLGRTARERYTDRFGALAVARTHLRLYEELAASP